jgi:hypothetical protein
LEQRHLPALVNFRISENLQKIMAKKWASKYRIADMAVLSVEEEARYFFTQLQRYGSVQRKQGRLLMLPWKDAYEEPM